MADGMKQAVNKVSQARTTEFILSYFIHGWLSF
jgi:hypothetical protein